MQLKMFWITTVGLVLAMTGLGAEERSLSFKGDLVSFLVHLNADNGIECSLDPVLMRTPNIRQVQEFQFRSGERTNDFLNRVAQSVNCNLQVIPPYYYFTTNRTPKLLGVASQFQAGKYRECIDLAAAITPSDPDANAIAGLARLLLESWNRKAYDQRQLDQILTGLKTSAARQNVFAGGTENQDEVVERLRKQIGTLWATQMLQVDNYLKVPVEIETAAKTQLLPSMTLTRVQAELILYAIDNCLQTLSKANNLFTDPANPQSKLTELRAELFKLYSSQKQIELDLEKQYQEAYKVWAGQNYESAYAQMAALQVDYDCPKVRFACGLLSIRNKAESVRRLRKESADNPPKQPLQQILSDPILCPVGVTDAALAALNDYLKLSLKKESASAPRHPGRQGAIYGLVVRGTSGQGSSSTMAIQLLPRLQNVPTAPKRTSPRDGGLASRMDAFLSTDLSGEQIEVHGIDARLDRYTVAAIQDSMRYITTTKIPDLYDHHRISVIFDKTVDIRFGGDSGGAAFALAALSAAKQIIPEPEICLTGAIRPYGDITAVGGIFPKTTAAVAEGFKALLVPEENIVDLLLIDFDKLGCVQVVAGRSLDDYIEYALPTQGKRQAATTWGLQTYATAYLLYKSGDGRTAKALLEKLIAACPQHISAQMLLAKLTLAGIQSGEIPTALVPLLQPSAVIASTSTSNATPGTPTGAASANPAAPANTVATSAAAERGPGISREKH